MVWSKRVVPLEDELLSSYLVRTAWAHHADPCRFCVHTLGPIAIWNRDIDRTAGPSLLPTVAERAELRVPDVESLTLKALEATLGARGGRRGTGPWINCLGLFHRTRRHHGLQACLECLRSSEGGYLRSWRLSFVVACPDHQSWLIDSCAGCDAPLTPHRQLIRRFRCDRCGRALQAANRASSLDEALAAQAYFTAGLATGEIDSGSGPIALAEVRRGVTLLRAWHLWPFSLPHPVEVQRAPERSSFFVHLRQWLLGLPASLAPIHGVVSPEVFQRAEAPDWLRPIVATRTLRQRVVKPAYPDLQSRLETISLAAGPNWRSRRASLLLSARIH